MTSLTSSIFHFFSQHPQSLADVFLHRVGTDAQLLRHLLIRLLLPIAEAEDGASRFGQASGDGFRLLQQGFVFPISVIDIRLGSKDDGLDVRLLHLLVFQPVEAGVSGGGVEPGICFFAQRIELLPYPSEDLAHDVLCLVRIAHQGGGVADEFGVHREEELPEAFLLRGFSPYVEYR